MEYVIYSNNRGDYIAGLSWDSQGRPEIRGGDAADAIRYTEQEAKEVVAALGKGYVWEVVE